MNLSAASITLGIANFRAQTLSTLLSSDADDSSFLSIFESQLQGMDGSATDWLSSLTSAAGVKDVASTGRNMALFDPESAYRMMTEINRRDVYYKAQFAELSQMATRLNEMEDVGLGLGRVTLATSDEGIRADLQHFVAQYNSWIQLADADLRDGGLLADTQAAQISQYELEQSVKYRFNGASHGVYGLGELGITIDANTRLATLGAAKLDAVLASNKLGVVATVQQFSANFAKSADLLNAEDNFMPRQLDNLDRVIDYITEHRSDLQAEFGTGDSAMPTGKIAQALAAYNQNYAT